MSDETTATEAEQNAPATPDASESETAPDDTAEVAPEVEQPDVVDDGTRPEPSDEPAGDSDADGTEPVEEVVPEGGVLGDHVRKAVADVRELEAVVAGEARITREHLAEIALRRAQADLATLLAACHRLLDELEGVSK